MHKFSEMFFVCIWLVVILVTCALLMGGLEEGHRVALLMGACVIACVFMECESRVQRARAPLILRDETMQEESKPPEGDPK